jgi:hypothetical protein
MLSRVDFIVWFALQLERSTKIHEAEIICKCNPVCLRGSFRFLAESKHDTGASNSGAHWRSSSKST